ncbi:MAG: hypothetical protein QOE70_6228 [Chthoniobacter sp.]|jgi:hypothetical protein|nr:hypothetical protein [Chthoniobacter sp.]
MTRSLALLLAVLGSAAALWAEEAPRPVALTLAPGQGTDLFGGRKHELALVIYCAPQQKCELRAKLFQVARTLAAPVPQPDQPALVFEPAPAIQRPAAYALELPKVENKTRFVVRFEARLNNDSPWQQAGTVNLAVYPAELLQPLRDSAAKDEDLFTLDSARDVKSFLEREQIKAAELGSTLPSDFATRGIILAQKEPETPQDWPAGLREGQALIVFHPPEPDELPRIVTSPLGRGLIVHVKMTVLPKLAESPRAQELFSEIINLVRTQLHPPYPL